jgi:hypothetical protein
MRTWTRSSGGPYTQSVQMRTWTRSSGASWLCTGGYAQVVIIQIIVKGFHVGMLPQERVVTPCFEIKKP